MPLEEVTFLRRDLEGATTESVAGVLGLSRPRVLAPARAGGGSRVAQERCRWHLSVATLAGDRPRAGDRVRAEDGSVWEVEEASVETLGTRYRCETVQVEPPDGGLEEDQLIDGDGVGLIDGDGEAIVWSGEGGVAEMAVVDGDGDEVVTPDGEAVLAVGV